MQLDDTANATASERLLANRTIARTVPNIWRADGFNRIAPNVWGIDIVVNDNVYLLRFGALFSKYPRISRACWMIPISGASRL